MNKNVFVRLEPSIKDFPKQFWIGGIYDEYDGFKVLLKNIEQQNYILRFEKRIIGYRKFDEGDRINSPDEYPCTSDEWSLFKSYDTDFIDWLNKETFSPYENQKILHIVILTNNDILDIIAFNEPIFEQVIG